MGRNREVDSWNYRRVIENKIKAMELGQHCRFSFDTIARAWPPVGNDGSILGAFKEMALASGGNRPEPCMTSEDRFRTFLAREGFVVVARDTIGALFLIERGRQNCPDCRGLGQVQREDELPDLGPISPSSTASWSWKPCQPCAGRGYLPAKGDPEARFGDHSASDAWIANRKRTSP